MRIKDEDWIAINLLFVLFLAIGTGFFGFYLVFNK